MFSYKRFFLAVLALPLLAACGGDQDACPEGDPSCRTIPRGPELEAEPPVPVGLRLELDGDLLVGEERQLRAFFTMDDGTEQPATEVIAFESSREEVATVDETGLVQVVAGGDVVLRATATHELLEEPLVGELTAVSGCTYPTFDGSLGQDKTMPPLTWSARSQDGNTFDFSLADVHCLADWKWAKTIHFVFSAGWCKPCADYAKDLGPRAAALRELGMQVVIVQIETNTGGPADSAFAYRHLRNVTGNRVPGISAGDAETFLEGWPNEGYRFLAESGFVKVFPTRIVVRTRDMRIIADASSTGPWQGRALPLEKIAENPETTWLP